MRQALHADLRASASATEPMARNAVGLLAVKRCGLMAGVALAAQLLCAAQATAEDRHPGPDARPDLRFEVAGFISPRCTIDQDTHRASFGQLLDNQTGGNVARQIDLALSIDCNSPFQVQMTSQNGGLLTQAAGGDGFRRLIPYDASLSLEGARRGLECSSDRMVAGGNGDNRRCDLKIRRDDGVSAPGALQLSLAADATPLLAGRYSDRIVVRISPLIGGDRD